MLTVPATTASLVVAGAPGASAAPVQAEPNVITFTARRSNVVPAVLDLGVTFIGRLDILDKDGKKIGDGSLNGAIVDLIFGVPTKLVAQVHAIFRLAQGEIHTSNMHTRVIPNPGVRHHIAVTGGTVAYRTARGSGTIEHITDTDTLVVLNVTVDPPPATQ